MEFFERWSGAATRALFSIPGLEICAQATRWWFRRPEVGCSWGASILVQPSWLTRLVAALEDSITVRFDDSLELLRGRRRISLSADDSHASESLDEETTDPDKSSFSGRAV